MKLTKTTPLKDVLRMATACSCTACSHGCTMGSGILVENDLSELAKFMNISEKKLKQKYLEEVEQFGSHYLRPKLLRRGLPFGKCIFFKNGCTVHPAKPLQCKIAMGCKEYSEDLSLWFMLNYLVDENNPEAIRQFNQYLNSGGKTLPGGTMSKLVPSRKELKKILEYEKLK